MSSVNSHAGISPLKLEGNVSMNWKCWYQRYDIYLKASKLDKESDERKVALLLFNLGDQCIEIYNSFNLEEDSKNKYDEVISKFDGYFSPKKNLTVERHKFLTRKQGLDESFDSYITDLVNKSLQCELGTLREDLVRDVLICGLNTKNLKLKEKLLLEPDLTLERAKGLCKAAELSEIHIQELDSKPVEISQVTSKQPRNKPNQYLKKNQSGLGQTTQQKYVSVQKYDKSSQPKYQSKTKLINNCRNCKKSHKINCCPAYGITCFKCGKLNHFAQCCQSSVLKKVHCVNEPSGENEIGLVDENVNFSVSSVSSVNNHNEWSENLIIRNKVIKFKLDTGAQTNVLSINEFKQLGLLMSIIKKSAISLTSFTGQKVPVTGKCDIDCKYKGKLYIISFVIINANCSPILGLETCSTLGMVKRSMNEINLTQRTLSLGNEVANQFSDLFDGKLGNIPGNVHIELTDNPEPKIDPPRRVPFSLLEPLKLELQKMESQGVIVKITEPTEWVNSMVIVKKRDSGLRICLDPRNLNKFIKRSHCQLPTVEEVASKFTSAKIFTVLDASSAFWMLSLDEESSRLCTFNTPYGRYRFLKLPYGISSAPEVFHTKISQLFENVEGAVTFIDAICISGPYQDVHDKRLKQVLTIA